MATQCHKIEADQDSITSCIQQSHKVLVVLRGAPGSGKSTIAKTLLDLRPENGVVCSTDDYFTVRGQYQFDASMLTEYHSRNYSRAKEALATGKSPIIIDNTNLFYTHFRHYLKAGFKHSYEIYVITTTDTFDVCAEILERRTTHNVPFHRILHFQQAFEHVNYAAELCKVRCVVRVRGDETLETAADQLPSTSLQHLVPPGISPKPNWGIPTYPTSYVAPPPGLPIPKTMRPFEAQISPPGLPSTSRSRNGFHPSLQTTASQLQDEQSATPRCVMTRDNSTQVAEVFLAFNEVDSATPDAHSNSLACRRSTTTAQDDASTQTETRFSILDALVAFFPTASIRIVHNLLHILGRSPESVVDYLVELGFSPVTGVRVNFRQIDAQDYFSGAALEAYKICHNTPPSEMFARLQQFVNCAQDVTELFNDSSDRIHIDLGENFWMVVDNIFEKRVFARLEPVTVPMNILFFLFKCMNGYAVQAPESPNHLLELINCTLIINQTYSATYHHVDISEQSMRHLNNLFGVFLPTTGFSCPVPEWVLWALQLTTLNVNRKFVDVDLLPQVYACMDSYNTSEFVTQRLDDWQISNLQRIHEGYPGLDFNVLKAMLRAADFDTSLVKSALENRYGPPNAVPTVYHDTPESASSSNLKGIEVFAAECRKKADQFRARANEERHKAARYSSAKKTKPAVAAVFEEASKLDRLAAAEERKIDEMLIEYNRKAAELDLHNMSTKAAMQVVIERLHELDEQARKSKNPSKTICVITGYGKNNNGASSILSSLKAYLNSNKYTYAMKNQGYLQISAKMP